MLRLIYTLLLVVFPIAGFANFAFHHLSLSDGLPQLSVLSLYQDHRKSIWIGTFAGAARYDGSFSYYTPNDRHQTPILGNEITAITGNDKEVCLLSENGLSLINLYDNRVVNIPVQGVKSIHQSRNRLWVSIGRDLYYLSANYQLIKSQLNYVEEYPITAVLEHSSGSLWIAHDRGISIIYPNRPTVTVASAAFSTTLFEDSNANVWVGTLNRGAMLINPQGDILNVLNTSNGLSNNYVRCIVEDWNRNLFIGTFNGLNQYNPFTKRFTVYRHSPVDNYSLSHNSVYALLIDHQETLWVGTYYGGLSFVNKAGNLFDYYNLLDFDHRNYTQVVASTIRKLRNKLYIATDGAGLKTIDLGNGAISCFPERFGTKNYYNNIKSLYIDSSEVLYVGVHLGGLYRYENGRFRYLPITLNDLPGSVNANTINDIVGIGDLLILATLEGLIAYDKGTGKSYYLLPLKQHAQVPRRLSTLLIDSRQRLWIGSKGAGLFCYNLGDKTLRKYLYSSEDGKISSNHITQIIESEQGDIYVTTFGGGVNRYDVSDDSFSPLLNLPYQYTQSIAAINDSILLVGAQSTLILYNSVRQNMITTIGKSSGLPLEELLEKSISMVDNQIYVGGKGGIIHFKSSNLLTPMRNDSIEFSRLYVNNQEVLPNQSNGILTQFLSDTKSLRLSHDHSSVRFLITTHNYIRHLPEEFEYCLQGHEEQWSTLSGSSSIEYMMLPPGKYHLIVRNKHNRQVKIELKLAVLPPWYRTWWAHSLYVVIGITLFLFLYFNWKNHRKLVLAEREALQIKRINQHKLDFFANISHEFRTPLSLIIGEAEQLVADTLVIPARKQVQRIHSNALKLSKLITELLDFQKQEQGNVTLSVYEIDVEQFVGQVFASFVEYAQHKNINYTLDFQLKKRPVWFDPQQMEKVMYNLLSNAFKFTPSGGAIKISCRYEDSLFTIAVIDTGCGIPKDEQYKVFDRFYQVTHSTYRENVRGTGTGIGLALTKMIVTTHHGTIHVASELEIGSTFTVSLLYGNHHFAVQEIMNTPYLPIEENVIAYKENSFSDGQTQSDVEVRTLNGDSPSILIVEDNEELLAFLTSLFEPTYQVIQAVNGMEGLNKAREFMPDLVLSDVMMPVMTGTEMCSAIKTQLDTSHIPVVLLTAKTAIDYMINGLQNGADDYICKPFDCRLLRMRCANIINNRRLLQQKFSTGETENRATIVSLVTTELDKQFADRLEKTLDHNFAHEHFDVAAFATEMCMSRTGLYNKVRALVGITPLELINQYRLKRAKELLIDDPTTPIVDIAERVGFSNVKYFSKCFKIFFGVSPIQMRVKRQN